VIFASNLYRHTDVIRTITVFEDYLYSSALDKTIVKWKMKVPTVWSIEVHERYPIAFQLEVKVILMLALYKKETNLHETEKITPIHPEILMWKLSKEAIFCIIRHLAELYLEVAS
jgi:hypothetical protein